MYNTKSYCLLISTIIGTILRLIHMSKSHRHSIRWGHQVISPEVLCGSNKISRWPAASPTDTLPLKLWIMAIINLQRHPKCCWDPLFETKNASVKCGCPSALFGCIWIAFHKTDNTTTCAHLFVLLNLIWRQAGKLFLCVSPWRCGGKKVCSLCHTVCCHSPRFVCLLIRDCE